MMQELNMQEIEAVSGGVTASELSNNLDLAAGAMSMVAGATWYVPSVSAALWVIAGGLGALGAVASMAGGFPIKALER